MNCELFIFEKDNKIPLVLFYKDTQLLINNYKKLVNSNNTEKIVIRANGKAISYKEFRILDLLTI